MIETSKTRELADPEETRRLIVPCFGFENKYDADAFMEGRGGTIKDRFEPIEIEDRMYVPHDLIANSDLDATMHGEGRNRRPENWIKIRNVDTKMPSGAYNVAVLIGGRREYYHYVHQTAKHPKWWYRIASGDRDCYAVWSRTDGERFPNNLFAGIYDEWIKVAYPVRSGRGVVYSRRMVFDHKGNPEDIRTTLTLIEFAILDRDSQKDDMIRVRTREFTNHSFSGTTISEPDTRDVEEVWRTLIRTAKAGFERKCSMVDKDDEAWRVRFLDQRKKHKEDGWRFENVINPIAKLNWFAALKAVREPWQLDIVLRLIRNRKEFDEHPMDHGTHYDRVTKILELYDCTDERRAELWKMVADYVEPSDNLWDYSGG